MLVVCGVDDVLDGGGLVDIHPTGRGQGAGEHQGVRSAVR